MDLLRHNLFLVPLASGFRSSQLRASTRVPRYTTFMTDVSAVFPAQSSDSFAKNERLDHSFQPVVIPAWYLSSTVSRVGLQELHGVLYGS